MTMCERVFFIEHEHFPLLFFLLVLFSDYAMRKDKTNTNFDERKRRLLLCL